jgi:hypothetical protein
MGRTVHFVSCPASRKLIATIHFVNSRELTAAHAASCRRREPIVETRPPVSSSKKDGRPHGVDAGPPRRPLLLKSGLSKITEATPFIMIIEMGAVFVPRICGRPPVSRPRADTVSAGALLIRPSSWLGTPAY